MVERIAEDVQALWIKPALLFIDSQGKATAGCDEDSNSQMGLVWANLTRLSQVLDCFVFTIHHPGHKEKSRPRGAYAQGANDEALIRVAKGRGNLRTVTVEKVKEGTALPPTFFRVIESGESVWAEPVRSNSRGGQHAAAVERLNEKIRAALEAVPGMTRDDLRETVKGSTDNFREALDDLLQTGEVVRRNGAYQLA